jgi:alpha-tubulin suppressor-like RCC1 family protein
MTSLSSGFMHSCALLVVGSVLCWGDNSYGQLGIGSTDTQHQNVKAALEPGSKKYLCNKG